MKLSTLSTLLWLLPSTAALIACGSSDPSPAPTNASSGTDPSLRPADENSPPKSIGYNAAGVPVFDRTIVHLNADGTQTVIRSPATAEEEAAEQAEFAGRLAEPATGFHEDTITHDSSCGSSDVWLFNNNAANCANNQSGDPEICFYGAGEANLNSYEYEVCAFHVCTWYNWAGDVGAYKVNNAVSGGIENYRIPPTDCGTEFVTWSGSTSCETVPSGDVYETDCLLIQ